MMVARKRSGRFIPSAEKAVQANLSVDRRVPDGGKHLSDFAQRDNARLDLLATFHPQDQPVLVSLLMILAAVLAAYHRIHRGGVAEQVAVQSLRPIDYRPAIDLNHCSWSELCLLPGIGPTLARRIVDDREHHGPYESLLHLQRVHGIGPRSVQQFQSGLAVVSPPSLGLPHREPLNTRAPDACWIDSPDAFRRTIIRSVQ